MSETSETRSRRERERCACTHTHAPHARPLPACLPACSFPCLPSPPKQITACAPTSHWPRRPRHFGRRNPAVRPVKAWESQGVLPCPCLAFALHPWFLRPPPAAEICGALHAPCWATVVCRRGRLTCLLIGGDRVIPTRHLSPSLLSRRDELLRMKQWVSEECLCDGMRAKKLETKRRIAQDGGGRESLRPSTINCSRVL